MNKKKKKSMSKGNKEKSTGNTVWEPKDKDLVEP